MNENENENESSERWSSIPEASEALGMTERSGWRWLKAGKILKHTDENGTYFTLADGQDDETDGETDGEEVDTEVSGDASVNQFPRVSGGKSQRGRDQGRNLKRQNKTSDFDPIITAQRELEATRLRLQIDQLNDHLEQRTERKAQIRRDRLEAEKLEWEREKEKAEKERLMLMEKHRIEQERKKEEERARTIREKIDRAKSGVIF